MEDRKITAALKVEASQMDLPHDLLERIQAEADRRATGWHGGWARLRLGHKLEIAAVCLLVAGLVGLAAVRNLHPGRVPAGQDAAMPRDAASGTPARQIFSGDSADGTLRVRIMVDRQGGEEWQVAATIENVAAYPVNLVYQCGNLVQLDGLQIEGQCPVLPELRFDPGQTKQVRYTLPATALDKPVMGDVIYRLLSEGKQDAVRSVGVILQEGVRECCPEPNWQAADVVAKLRAAGIEARLSGETSLKLFGARQVQGIAAAGQNLVVYVFDSTAAARGALQAANDRQSTVVDWAGNPRWFLVGNLLVQIDFTNEAAATNLQAALEGSQPTFIADPPSKPGTAAAPNYADVVSGHIPGGPKLPNWQLTDGGIKKVTAMLQAAEWMAGDEAPPQPSAGPSQPLTLVLELRSGETLTIRMAADCTTSDRSGGSQATACRQAEDDVLVFASRRGWRLRAPALVQWLTGEWQQDVLR